MKQVTISKMAFIFFYVMMLFPLIRKILKIYYLNKIVIPDFIVDYVEDKYWLVGIAGYYSGFTSILHFSAFHVLLYLSFYLRKKQSKKQSDTV